MKNIKTIYFIALIAALAIFSCATEDGGDGGDKNLGTIEIWLYGEAVGPDNPAETGNTLLASYEGSVEKTLLSYQWKWTDSDGVTTDVGRSTPTYTPDDPGTYTVTVSAPGYPSKTSAPVTVGGQPTPDLSGTLTIQVNGATVTTAQTGAELTAVYSGNEVVSYQWFKDKANVTEKSTTYTAYTPTESGSYSVEATFSGYRAATYTVTVTGEAKITITFNLNGGGYDHPTKAIAPGDAIGGLPSAPLRNGFTFVGWFFTETDDEGNVEWRDEVLVTTEFNEATTVYAKWSFSGGIPYIDEDEDTLVHPNPLMEKGLSFAGDISTEDGAITYSAGAFQYKFPTGFTISDYAYFIVRFELIGVTGTPGTNTDGSARDPNARSGTRLRQYGNEISYAGVDNEWPWLSNTTSTGIRFPISGAGNTGGFSILFNGVSDGTISVRITSITFYKLPLYTVTFDLDGGAGTVPTGVSVYEGSTLGAQFPTTPTKTDYTFTGWKNAAGATVTGTTPIMGNWTLTAQWVLTSELGDEWIELITTTATSAPVYGFLIPNGETLGDYDRIIVKIKSDASVSGRLRAWGVYNLTTWTNVNSRPGMGNTAGDKLLTNPGLDGFSHNGAWVEYVLPLNAIEATNQTGATGLAAIAFGVIAPSGGSGQRIYYVKDIVLANADKSKSVPALRPDDAQLWGGNGGSAYVTQNGSDVVSRMILPYE